MTLDQCKHYSVARAKQRTIDAVKGVSSVIENALKNVPSSPGTTGNLCDNRHAQSTPQLIVITCKAPGPSIALNVPQNGDYGLLGAGQWCPSAIVYISADCDINKNYTCMS